MRLKNRLFLLLFLFLTPFLVTAQQDWNKPDNGDAIVDYTDGLLTRDEHLGKMNFTGDTNVPTGFIRSNSASDDVLEKYNGSTWTVLTFIQDLLDHVADNQLHSGVPTASVIFTARSTVPSSSWLMGDGSAVSRATYADLFAAIGTTYGAGNGSTTFNLPDCRGRFLLGKAASGTGSTLAETGGLIDHVHTGPSHTHSTSDHTHDLSNHTHAGPSHRHAVSSHTHSVPAHYHAATGNGADINITSSGSHTHDIPRRAASGSASGDARTAMTNGTASADTGGITQSSAHTHPNVNFAGRVGNVSGAINGDSSMTSGSGGSGFTDYEGTGNTGVPSTNTSGAGGAGTTGSGGTGNTGTGNPPYIVMNCMIKT